MGFFKNLLRVCDSSFVVCLTILSISTFGAAISLTPSLLAFSNKSLYLFENTSLTAFLSVTAIFCANLPGLLAFRMFDASFAPFSSAFVAACPNPNPAPPQAAPPNAFPTLESPSFVYLAAPAAPPPRAPPKIDCKTGVR